MYARIKGNARRSPELSTNFLLAISSPIIGEQRRLIRRSSFSLLSPLSKYEMYNGSVIIFESSKFISKRQLAKVILILRIILFFIFHTLTTIQLLIQLLIQSHVKSAQDKGKCLISALAFAFFCRQRRRILSFIRSKTLFPNFFQTRKRGTNRSYLASNRSNGAQYRFQIFIASPLSPRPRRVGTRK